MNLSIRKSSIVCFGIVFFSVVLLRSEHSAASEQAALGVQLNSSQGTETKIMPDRGKPLDEPDQIAKAQISTPQTVPLQTTASFYHIPGSVLKPVDSITALSYDGNGCVHATAGASYLLVAPLEIPDGSNIVLLRLYYDDTSASDDIGGWITRYNAAGTGHEDLVYAPSTGSAGPGSNYGNLTHTVDTYDWSYVLHARLNATGSALKVCGLRVMYYAPISATKSTVFFPIVGGK